MGRASALALAAAGAQVLVHYGRGANEADGVVAEIRKAGGRADAIATDLAAADSASKLARQARSIVGDRLDILVANAGVSKAATIEETTVEDFDKLFAVNVRAPFFLVQQLLSIMSKGSSIVFLSSLAAHAVVGTAPAYAATKGAIDTLVKHFNKRDYKAAERYWSSNYIQHSAHIAPGRDGLFNLVRSTPPTLKYEPALIVAENDYVIVHGRFSGTGRPRSWIAADVVRVADGMLAEHWDVLQDEATKAESRSGLPMFGTTFPE
jgi:NAD(P)-dependent dehydrogenase (short-subunit alcohol dehydrogenase family)